MVDRTHTGWTSTQIFAVVYGIVFLLVGALGFFPGLLTPPAPEAFSDHAVPVQVDGFEGYLFGLFHVNWLHNLVHLLFGIMGMAMARTFSAARWYGKIVAVSYGILAVMGLIPVLNTFFGLIPLHGNDVWLHLLLALPAAYFGFAKSPRERHVTAAERV